MQSADLLHSFQSRSPLSVFKHTIQHGGLSALYTGMGLPLAAQAVYKATVFCVNNKTQEWILDHKTNENLKTGVLLQGRLTNIDRFWCGCLGGAVNAFLFVTPVELVRNQLIAQDSKLAAGQTLSRHLKTSMDVVVHILQNHGVASLWRGSSMAVARDGLGCGCFFLTMAWTQQRLTPPGEKPSMTTNMIAGGVAGLSFWLAALPLDTVKTWVQSSDVQCNLSSSQAIRNVIREHGVIGMIHQTHKGWQLAYTRGIPSAAVTISVYSAVYQYLSGRSGL
jgi:solute carrier family 25 (mitochondrial carnitine/acylcarnitine transporter), member 20/29